MLSCGCCELVILNGGEAGARDPTMVGGCGVVDRTAQAACSVRVLSHRIAALRVS